MGFRGLRFAAAAMLAAVLRGVSPAAAAQDGGCLDVALVLAVDASASVSAEEYSLQQNGIAAAFRDPSVRDAIGRAGRVAVAIVVWGSEGLPKPQSGWVAVDTERGAEQFASLVEAMPRQVTGDTGLGSGLMASLQKLQSLDVCAVRRIVNVSGDGEETRVVRGSRRSLPPSRVRDIAQAMDIEINALAISNEEKDLARYYASDVITGPDAFVMDVRDYEGFAGALRRKLIREISPLAVSAVTPE